MNITAYFDESGSHADAPVTAMAGYVADERQWRQFNARVGKLFAQFGVRTFHLVDLRHSDGDFAGWSVDRKIEFTDELQHIANESLESGVTAFLSEENYQKHYCALDWPRRARKDTKYCILFRACMGITVEFRARHAEMGVRRRRAPAARRARRRPQSRERRPKVLRGYDTPI